MTQRKSATIRLPWLAWLLLLALVPGFTWAQQLSPAKSAGQPPRRTPAAQGRAEVPQKSDNKAQPPVRALFSEQERSVALLGNGNPVAQMLVLREVNRVFPLLPRQRAALQALAREEQPVLLALREKRARQERALEEAIYGENFDAKAVEQLVNEAAETQKELLKRQAEVESRLVRLLAQENRAQARYFLLLNELVVGPRRNQIPVVMLLNRQYAGQWRILQEMFGEDMEMLIPSFNNPLAVLLVLRQLELTPEQKTEFKALAQEVRRQLLEEREQPNPALREQQPRNELTPLERLTERLETRERIIAEAADRQGRQMKRQAHTETRIRQILNPKQWSDYTTLLRGILSGNLTNNLGRPALPVQPPNLKNLRQERPQLNQLPFEQP